MIVPWTLFSEEYNEQGRAAYCRAPHLFFIKLRIAEFWFGAVSENLFDLLLNGTGIVFIDNYYVFIFASKIGIPDGTEQEKALSRTTHLCIAAHQDDIEFMAFSPIAECFGSKDKYFCGVVTTDGAGSPRNGLYENYTDEYMKAIRIDEQKKAAAVGEYTAQILLGYSSNEVKDKNNGQVIKDYVEILKATKPEYVYIHNLADKHNTHVATAVNAIKALRQLQPDDRPKKAYGCEVWRDLDWLNDDEKILLDCSGHQNLARALSSVFDSQIIGGKRYDVAVEGRRLANATFGQSHSCDTYAALNYAMDLTPLIHDETIDIAEYVTGYIQRFSDNVKANLNKLS